MECWERRGLRERERERVERRRDERQGERDRLGSKA
jgi:hypothetical protein